MRETANRRWRCGSHDFDAQLVTELVLLNLVHLGDLLMHHVKVLLERLVNVERVVDGRKWVDDSFSGRCDGVSVLVVLEIVFNLAWNRINVIRMLY